MRKINRRAVIGNYLCEMQTICKEQPDVRYVADLPAQHLVIDRADNFPRKCKQAEQHSHGRSADNVLAEMHTVRKEHPVARDVEDTLAQHIVLNRGNRFPGTLACHNPKLKSSLRVPNDIGSPPRLSDGKRSDGLQHEDQCVSNTVAFERYYALAMVDPEVSDSDDSLSISPSGCNSVASNGANRAQCLPKPRIRCASSALMFSVEYPNRMSIELIPAAAVMFFSSKCDVFIVRALNAL